MPAELVAVVAIALATSAVLNASTATPGTGVPEVSSRTVPDIAAVPVALAALRAWATCSARSRSAADWPTSLASATVITIANTVTAASRPSSEIGPRDSHGRCRNVPVASGGTSGGAAVRGRLSGGDQVRLGRLGPDSSRCTVNTRTSGEPVSGRRARVVSSTIRCSPGASRMASGAKPKRTLSSASPPASRPVTVVLPLFSITAPNEARRPP